MFSVQDKSLDLIDDYNVHEIEFGDNIVSFASLYH